MINKTKFSFILACWMGLVLTGFSQVSPLYFEHLVGERGLPQNMITCILQDHEGFIWFGTREGLYRFDGHQTTAFLHDPTDPENSLPSNVIFSMHEDQQRNLWVTSPIGLILVDKVNLMGRLFQPLPGETKPMNIIKTITEDPTGRLWVGTEGSVCRFNPLDESFEIFTTPNDSRFPIVESDGNGKIWGFRNEGIYGFDPDLNRFSLFPLQSSSGESLTPLAISINESGIMWVLTHGSGLYQMNLHHPGEFFEVPLDHSIFAGVYNIMESDGNLWLSSSEGLQLIETTTGKVTDFVADADIPGSLHTNSIYYTFQDRMDNLWVGTLYGISRASLKKNPFQTYQITASPVTFHRKENQILQILEDRKGRIWLGIDDLSICRYDIQNGTYTYVPLNPENPKGSYPGFGWPIAEDSKGQIWAGSISEKGLFLWMEEEQRFKKFASEISPTVITTSPTGEIWMGSFHQGIASFDPISEKFTYYKPSTESNGFPAGTRIFDIVVGRSGSVWIAAAAQGIVKLEPASGSFTHYHHYEKSPAKRLNDNAVLSVFEDSKGMIWIGTSHGGLNGINPITNEISTYTQEDGLSSNRVNSIIEDDFGNLWLGTNKGLSKFDPITKIFRNFEESHGLPSHYFLQNSAFAKNGTLYFGTPHGFLAFDPESIEETELDLLVYITQVKAFENTISHSSGYMEIPFKENFLSFEFTALNYYSPDKTHFAYQLEGVDHDWVYSGNRRFVSYSQLRPGTYTFKAKASNDNLSWQENIASVTVRILPPWWMTWWAYLLYACFILLLLYFLKSLAVKRVELKHKLAIKEVEAEKMQEIDHLKSRFFANNSHEFRTPLTMILGPLDKILEKAQGQEKGVFQMMQRNARRLQHLINQLLDLSKLESGSMQLELKPTALTSFLKVLVLSFSSLAERRQINYILRYPTENPIAYFDGDKIEKIFTNLISNAFKFSEQDGEVTVTAKIVDFHKNKPPVWYSQQNLEGDLKTLELKVIDKGSGIPPQQINKIFDRFYQIESHADHVQEGSGIGLSLVRELVELYDGEITVKSKIGEGSTFTVKLPLVMAGQEELAVVNLEPKKLIDERDLYKDALLKSGSKPEPAHSQARNSLPIILVVEDNADIRQFIRETLHMEYEVLEANDGEEGFEVAVDAIPDLILTDVMMPRLDGVEMCKKLKNDEKTAHIPLVLLTAKASGESRINGLETGADDYITKPFEANELKVRVRNLIANREKMRKRYSREVFLQPAGVSITSVDEKFLNRIMEVMEVRMDDHLFGVEALGREVGMSRMQLHRKLKALTDFTPGDFIKLIRLKKAAELFTKGAGNISEVAMMVGFQDPSYFTKCFQKQFGEIPSEFIHSLKADDAFRAEFKPIHAKKTNFQ